MIISLDVDKAEWLDEIEKGDISLKAMVEESIGERERKKFVYSKVKLTLYKTFGKDVQFNNCLSDARTRLLFMSGTHGFNEELGRCRGSEGKKECVLCGDECEGTLLDCPVYSSI